MRLALILLFLITQAACAITSDGPLLNETDALPLQAGLNETIYFDWRGDEGGPLTLHTAPDGQTLILIDAEHPTDRPREDTAFTFYPAPQHADLMIAQGYILRDETRKGDQHGYVLTGCREDGMFAIYGFETEAIFATGPFPGVELNGLFAASATSVAGLNAFVEAAVTSDTFDSFPFTPDVPCAMIFQ